MLNKILLLLTGALIAGGLFFGCSAKVDEEKSVETIQDETSSMSVSRIREHIAAYEKAIVAKKGEVEQTLKPLNDMNFAEKFSQKAQDVRNAAAPLEASLAKLQRNLSAYQSALVAKLPKGE